MSFNELTLTPRRELHTSYVRKSGVSEKCSFL